MRDWSLAHLTVVRARPAELVEIAAQAGYDAVCPIVGLVSYEGVPVIPLRKDDPDTLAMARALKATGLRINTADGFVLTDHTDMLRVAAALSLAAELGARNVNVIVHDSDPARGFDRLCALDTLAQAVGLAVALEFTPLSSVASMRDALRWLERSGSANIGLMIDQLHLAQSGETPADVAKLAPSLVQAAQLCDGPAGMDHATYARRAIYERLAPGDGELPVREFMAALPPGLTCALEVPRVDETDLPARARRMLEAARRCEL